MSALHRKRDVRNPAGPGIEALEQGLVEAVPGLRILDRDLSLGDETVADLAAVDTTGRLMLVLVLEADDDFAALLALDALAFARQNAALFPRHFDCEELLPDAPPRICLIAPEKSPRLAARLAPLLGKHVELFELRTLQSAGGAQVYLVRSAEGAAPGAEEDPGPDQFLASLPREEREAAEQVLQRMERMDDELRVRNETQRLTWSLGNQIVARLESDQGRLLGFVPPQRARNVVGQRDVELFVGEAMGRFRNLLEDERVPALPRLERPLAEHPLPERPAPAGPGGPSEPILTREEIEAFRDL